MTKTQKLRKWNEKALQSLDDETFIRIAAQATMDRSVLKLSKVIIETKIKNGAPPDSVNLILKEAERRKISLADIANKFVEIAKEKKSLFGKNIVFPKKWRRYEIHVAEAILTILEKEKAVFDDFEFDASRKGVNSGSERQVDLLIWRNKPNNVVACEFRKHETKKIEISGIEAFVTFLTDIQANKGVMVSPCGFQSGAESMAKHYDIDLLIFKEVGAHEAILYFPDIKDNIDYKKTYGLLIGYNKPILCMEMSLTHKSLEKQPPIKT